MKQQTIILTEIIISNGSSYPESFLLMFLFTFYLQFTKAVDYIQKSKVAYNYPYHKYDTLICVNFVQLKDLT